MKKSNFQLLNQVSESSARDALQRLDLVSNPYAAYSSVRASESGNNAGMSILPLFDTGYKANREKTHKIALALIRVYFYTFNQRSETLAKLFVINNK